MQAPARAPWRCSEAGRRRWLASVAVLSLGGCAVSEALHRDPGVDVSVVRPGATRAQVEAVLGQPQGEWVTAVGVRYRLYRYHGGTRPDPMQVTGAVLLEIATLGLVEAIRRMVPEPPQLGTTKRPLMAVAYDRDDVVIGVFDDIDRFAALPADGRSPGTAAPPAPAAVP